MKPILTIIASSPLVLCGLDKMSRLFEDYAQNSTGLRNKRGGRERRDVRDQMGAALDTINRYGCWCYFNAEDFSLARGTPVNGIDELCRTLHWGYQCVAQDTIDPLTLEPCVPWDVHYNIERTDDTIAEVVTHWG